MSFEGIYPPAARKTASGTVKTGRGKVRHVRVEPQGTAGTLIIYDNTSAAGTVLLSIVTPADYNAFEVEVNLDAFTGIYIALSNCYAVVNYL